MGEGHQQQHIYPEPQKLLLPQHASGSSRRRTAGEIVQVQGGHIMRSMGRKDRHSKVCTAKGPRDRRVRLSAHTAIQFYDVQDRLGFDRPSKAVDWLIRNAKAAIDELAELPPWQPTSAAVTDASDVPPTSLQSDAIASTVKSSFFPAADYAHAEDLRLSLQSFHNDGVPLHHRGNDEALFSDSATTLMFEQNQKMVRCMPAMGGEGSGGTGGFGFNVAPPPSQPTEVGAIQMHQLLGQSSFLAQRGTLQSSSSPLARSWMEAIEHPSQTLPMGGRSLGGSFSSFRVPARIGGEEENSGGISDLPSAASR